MSISLSDKAKGKLRAVEEDENEHHTASQSSSNAKSPVNASRSFTVRFSEGVADLLMTVSPQDTVREVQRRVSGL